MVEYYTEIAGAVLKIVISVIGIVMTCIILPWIKSHAIPWLKDKRLFSLCLSFVQAAEKLAKSGAIPKEEKKAYVVSLLEDRGIKVTKEVEAFIESAVEQLDLAFGNTLAGITGQFVSENDSAEVPQSESLPEEQQAK